KFREAYAYDKDNPNTGYQYLEPPHMPEEGAEQDEASTKPDESTQPDAPTQPDESTQPEGPSGPEEPEETQ
ncbi:MAG: hypothetical protein KAX19_07590, partial [Candidatus Brocadiae bacterium]|nr:hypothetical protein [Candidatus Brocadiia bacterium]